MLKRLWRDSCGSVVTPEVVLIGAFLVIGAIVGLSALRGALLTEVKDISEAVHKIDFTPTVTHHDHDDDDTGGGGGNGLGPGHTHGNAFGPNHTHGNGHGLGHTHGNWP